MPSNKSNGWEIIKGYAEGRGLLYKPVWSTRDNFTPVARPTFNFLKNEYRLKEPTSVDIPRMTVPDWRVMIREMVGAPIEKAIIGESLSHNIKWFPKNPTEQWQWDEFVYRVSPRATITIGMRLRSCFMILKNRFV